MFTLASAAREDDTQLFALHFAQQVLSYEDLFGLSMSGCLLEGCKLTQCDFGKADFVDVVFQNCDLSGSDFSESSLVRCRFIDCKGVGLRARSARLRHVELEGCNFSYGIFDENDWQNVAVQGCSLEHGAFAGCKLKLVTTRASKWSGINFFQTALKGMDFTTCELEGISISDELWELKGAAVTRDQAGDLARLMGVLIQE